MGPTIRVNHPIFRSQPLARCSGDGTIWKPERRPASAVGRFSCLVAAILGLSGLAWPQPFPEFVATDAFRIYRGEQPGDWFGARVQTFGDFDGLGTPDLVIAARFHDSAGQDAGRVYVYSGETGALLYTLDGEAAGDEFGHRLEQTGDQTGDELADFLVGAYINGALGPGTGRLYLYRGEDGALERQWTGEAANSEFGHLVMNVGDVTGDGRDDLVVGAYAWDRLGPKTGKAYLYSDFAEAPTLTWEGEAAGDRFGYRITAVGDLDGDSIRDLLISAPVNDDGGIDAGKVYAVSGIDGAAIYTMSGDEPGAQFGLRTEAGIDYDGDNVDDFIVGAIGYSGDAGPYAGRVDVRSGKTGAIVLSLFGREPQEQLGQRIDASPDLNRDGRPDIVISAPQANGQGQASGRVIVLSGADLSLMYEWSGDGPGDRFGRSLHGAVDFNGDGFDDVLVAAPQNMAQGVGPGYVRAFSGRDGRPLFTIRGEAMDDEFGHAINLAGDINGDGLVEFTVGAVGADGPAVADVGAGYVFLAHALYLGGQPLVRGVVGEAIVTGAAPGEEVMLLSSVSGLGEGPVIAALGGLRLDLLSPVYRVATTSADAGGVTVFRLPVEGLPDIETIWFQAVVQRGPQGEDSVKSNPITLPITG